MSFRLRIVLMTTVLITLLFSVGGTMLIHSSFQNSLEKEEEVIIDTNEMFLRMLEYVGKDESWVSEEELIAAIENLCKQDSIYMLQLMQGEEIIYNYQKGDAVVINTEGLLDLEANRVEICYSVSEKDEYYIQSAMAFVLNSHIYYLNIGKDITDIYNIRQEQIGLFQGIFLCLSFIGMFLSWVLATFITRHLRKLTKAAKEIGGGNLSYRSNIQSKDEVGALGAAFDNMAEKLEETITLLKESAEQKEMFMGAFTHELKTPMTSIIGYADLLRA
ncbi:MAG: HAMP domain-containing protein, partial [Agathobacter sp.]|nr:HAMP domain-containing protein [Agathobacter sp.]